MEGILKIPGYIWTFLALTCGLIIGGVFSEQLSFVAQNTERLLNLFIQLVPILIFVALSPAIKNLVAIGGAGKLAGGVVLWYVMTSLVAGLIGLLISSLIFDINFSSEQGDASSAWSMLSLLSQDSGASWPLIAIVIAIFIGLIASRVSFLGRILGRVEKALANSVGVLNIFIPPIVFFLGITLGVNSGALESIQYYVLMTAYTLLLCLIWFSLYVVLVLKVFAQQPIKKILNEYYLPTAAVAAGTCSSLATLPVNLNNIKKYGVKDSIANFVIPLGAVINMDTSALAYVAYAPFIMTVVFDLPLSWSVLVVAWPAVVLFTIAAPGLPAGMGTALWSSTLFASLLGMTGDTKTEFITTWIALSGGLPDMFRTATNCTADGFTSILFNHLHRRKIGENDNLTRD